MRLRSPLVATLLMALVGGFAHASPTGWILSGWAESTLRAEPVESLLAGDLIVCQRNPEASHADGALAFAASSENVSIVRWAEVRRVLVSPATGDSAELPASAPQSETMFAGPAAFRVSASPRGAALVVAADKAGTGKILETSKVLGRHDNPEVRGPSAFGRQGPDGVWYNSGERTRLTLDGTYVKVHLPTPTFLVHGSLFAYWHATTLVVSTAAGVRSFISEVVERRTFTGQGVLVETEHIWHELHAADHRGQLDLKPEEDRLRTTIFSRKLQFSGAASISVDALSRVNGTVPSDMRSDGAAMWVAGNVSGTIGFSEDAIAPPFPHYPVAFAGEIHQISRGGGQALFAALGGTPASSALLAGVLALLAFLFRDALAHGVAKIQLPLYTKLRKEKLLNVAARDTLYRLIQGAPGIHFLALQKAFTEVGGGAPIAYGALAYHLSQLERFQFVVSKREGRYRRYFDLGGRIGADAARIALLQTRPIPFIARLILERPGLTQSDLQEGVASVHPLTRQAVAYHLRRLVSKELVVREDRGRFAHFRPTERLERLRAYVEPTPEAPTGPVLPVAA